MSTKNELHLYFDDTGSRRPDYEAPLRRDDGMDCFGLGGILLKAEETDFVYARHRRFCERWKIDYPLHSQQIRGGRGKFGWLKNPATAADFFPDLHEFLIELPVVGVAAIIDRQGYRLRYQQVYDGTPWLMCKTACSILAERSAKWARDHDRRLRIFFEQSGRFEDNAIKDYVRSLKKGGMPFAGAGAGAYAPLVAAEFRDIIRGEPRERTKSVPMIQIADLYLYAMAKGGYDPMYRPYRELLKAGKIIDALLPSGDIAARGVKYSCFDNKKKGDQT